ncbi:MAG: hypothetical protein C0603_09615 [Denitrovibrio sp.]|nr:MAG: hypothetical protein C0603_09615 [Denitrovibrio sp.]
MQKSSTTSQITFYLINIAISVVIIYAGLSFGGSFISPFEIFNPDNNVVALQIRLPRVLAGFMIGGGLSVVGMSFQTWFRNPLADPFILGVAGAAAVGVVVGMIFQIDSYYLSRMIVFTFSMISIALIFYISGIHKRGQGIKLILIGVGLNFFFTSVITVLHIVMSDRFSKNIILWYMGDTSSLQLRDSLVLSVFVMICSIMLIRMGKQMNLYMLGDDIAESSGLDLSRFSMKVFLLGSVITAILVTFCCSIGFIGIVVPHIAKIITGYDFRRNMPVSFFAGGIAVVLIDTFCRTAFFPREIPLGAVTALVGAPFFIHILRKGL